MLFCVSLSCCCGSSSALRGNKMAISHLSKKFPRAILSPKKTALNGKETDYIRGGNGSEREQLTSCQYAPLPPPFFHACKQYNNRGSKKRSCMRSSRLHSVCVCVVRLGNDMTSLSQGMGMPRFEKGRRKSLSRLGRHIRHPHLFTP